jgi:hypothetical protein
MTVIKVKVMVILILNFFKLSHVFTLLLQYLVQSVNGTGKKSKLKVLKIRAKTAEDNY